MAFMFPFSSVRSIWCRLGFLCLVFVLQCSAHLFHPRHIQHWSNFYFLMFYCIFSCLVYGRPLGSYTHSTLYYKTPPLHPKKDTWRIRIVIVCSQRCLEQSKLSEKYLKVHYTTITRNGIQFQLFRHLEYFSLRVTFCQRLTYAIYSGSMEVVEQYHWKIYTRWTLSINQ